MDVTPVILQGACMREPVPERPRWGRLKKWGRPLMVAGGLLTAAAVGATVEKTRNSQPQPMAAPETTTTTTTTLPSEDYQVVLQKNLMLSEAELNSRLLSKDQCIPIFWGNVLIAENGVGKGILQYPVVFSDQDIFYPAKGHKFGRPTGVENYDKAPYALVSNIDSASHEAAFHSYFLDNKDYGYKFTDPAGQPVEVGGAMYPNATEFMSHVLCSNEVSLQRNPSDQTFYLSLPDGTRVSQFIRNEER